MRSDRRQDICDIGHRSKSAHQLALAVVLESPGSGEADCRNTGDDAESLCHGGRALREMDEFRFVHGLLRIKDEHEPPEDPGNLIVRMLEKRLGAGRAGLCGEVGELPAQGRSLCLRAAEVAADASDSGFDGPRFDVAPQLRNVEFGELDRRR